jgi:hypothetical protein
LSERIRRNRKGLSVVISTVILSATLLVVVLTASTYANQLLRAEVQNSEFNQAKEVLSSLDKMIVKVTSNTGASGYIRSGFVTTYPSVPSTGKSLKIYANNALLKGFETTTVSIHGGYEVTGAFQSISGVSSPMVVGVSSSNGWIFTNRTDAEEAFLDYSRVRCVYKGVVQLYNGTAFESLNVIELTAIQLVRGSIEFKDSGSFIVQNQNLETYQYEYAGNVAIRAELGNLAKTQSLSQLGGNPSYHTLVNLFIIKVQVSVIPG